MPLSIDNFRAQITNNNYGNIIADNNGVKTVNSSWFKRTFSIFRTTTTADQNQDTAINFYKAVKAEVGKHHSLDSEEISNEVSTFLADIKETLNVVDNPQEANSQITSTHTAPLERTVMSDIIKKMDELNYKIRENLLDVADDLPDDDYNSESLDQDKATLEDFYPEKGMTVDKMLDDLDKDLRHPTLKNIVGHTKSCAVLLDENSNNNIWKNKTLLKKFRESVQSEMNFRSNPDGSMPDRDFDELSMRDLKRLVKRQYGNIMHSLSSGNVPESSSDIARATYLGKLCIATLTPNEFELYFGVKLVDNGRPGSRARTEVGNALPPSGQNADESVEADD